MYSICTAPPILCPRFWVQYNDVPLNVVRSVAQNVAHSDDKIIEFIKSKIRENDRITRKSIADSVGVSVKTIERIVKKIKNVKYIGVGKNGHWELKE